jgi:tetratricopeptide (TPR) repeat protein
MSKQIDRTLFILPSMPRLYQQLLAGVVSYEALGKRIIGRINLAYAFRQIEQVKELARILINIPIREYQLIAQYYLVWCKCRDLDYRADVLERIIEQLRTYKAKALISRAAFDVYQGNTDNALHFYSEAIKASLTISEYMEASRGVAMVKSLEGFSRSALTDLEMLIPVIRHAEPQVYYSVLNSYAVELGETGRKQEARNVSRIVLASPFAPYYPEWQETANELKEPNRSIVAFKQSPPRKARPMPEHKHEAKHESKPQAASVVTFPPLKEAPPPQKPERLSPQEINDLSTDEKRELVLAALRTGKYTPFDYDRFMVMVGLVEAGPSDKILDLEDEETLRDIMVLWSNQIEPEELAAVLSVLRDCDDSLRRNEIIDQMIRIAFEESLLCGTTEDAWRFRVERRLPEK